jgi:hypothetical protein
MRSTVTHKFQEGDFVSLKEDYTDFLPAGSHGSVFCLYMTTPPAYEINFIARDGRGMGAIMDEDELERCADPKCLHLADE